MIFLKIHKFLFQVKRIYFKINTFITNFKIIFSSNTFPTYAFKFNLYHVTTNRATSSSSTPRATRRLPPCAPAVPRSPISWSGRGRRRRRHGPDRKRIFKYSVFERFTNTSGVIKFTDRRLFAYHFNFSTAFSSFINRNFWKLNIF